MSLTGVLFVLGFLAGCVLALTRGPIYGLMAYVGEYFIHPPSRWWGQGILLEVRWSVIAAAITLLAVLMRRGGGPAIPFSRYAMPTIFVLFIVWLGVQMGWALDSPSHREIFDYYVKFALVMFLVYRCVDSEKNLRLILWTFVLGCFYFGVIAFVSYDGGRFEGFGGPGTGEANAAALTMVTGIFAGAGLFLAARPIERAALLVIIPFILNGVVTTVSRSGFLAIGIGGLIFNYFAPAPTRRQVGTFSVLALVLFLMLAGPTYWTRMQSLTYAGEEVAGVDTGAGRLAILSAQVRMFVDHPLGCGAMCTTVLSREYLDSRYLASANGGAPERASHNTFMTMLVDHGVPGALFYISMTLWIVLGLRRLSRQARGGGGLISATLPAIAAIFAAMFVGDMFVTHSRTEIRIWFLGLLMAMLTISAQPRRAAEPELKETRLPSTVGR